MVRYVVANYFAFASLYSSPHVRSPICRSSRESRCHSRFLSAVWSSSRSMPAAAASRTDFRSGGAETFGPQDRARLDETAPES